jgi:hypothetical protein
MREDSDGTRRMGRGCARETRDCDAERWMGEGSTGDILGWNTTTLLVKDEVCRCMLAFRFGLIGGSMNRALSRKDGGGGMLTGMGMLNATVGGRIIGSSVLAFTSVADSASELKSSLLIRPKR